MAAIANVALSDTFNTQRVKLNRSLVRLNNFANNESQITANTCLLYTSPSPRDGTKSRMPSSA